jgi:hypothetical protein
MDEIRSSARKRFCRIAIFELLVFLVFQCGVDFLIYTSTGKPRHSLSSVVDVLHYLTWPGIAIALFYPVFALRRQATISPLLLAVFVVLYGIHFAGFISNYFSLLVVERLPTPLKAAAILPWLFIRIWFMWLLTSGALKYSAALKASATDSESTPAQS